MPLTNREALQLGLLILCVPLQYFLSNHFSTTVTERSQLGYKLAGDLQHWKEYFHIDVHATWQRIIGYLVTSYASFTKSRRLMAATLHGMHDDVNAEPPESPAVEVLQYRQRNYASAHQQQLTAVRSRRPPHLRYRVGQVVTHKTYGYRAVIVGWDLRDETGGGGKEATFPGVAFDTQSQLVQATPHYTLLIDQRDSAKLANSGSPSRQVYIVQTQLELMKNTKVQHPELDNYFLYFDGGQYIPKDALRKIYPKD